MYGSHNLRCHDSVICSVSYLYQTKEVVVFYLDNSYSGSERRDKENSIISTKAENTVTNFIGLINFFMIPVVERLNVDTINVLEFDQNTLCYHNYIFQMPRKLQLAIT